MHIETEQKPHAPKYEPKSTLRLRFLRPLHEALMHKYSTTDPRYDRLNVQNASRWHAVVLEGLEKGERKRMWYALKCLSLITANPNTKNRDETRGYLSRLYWAFAESKEPTENMLADRAMTYLLDSIYTNEDAKKVIRLHVETEIKDEATAEALRVIENFLWEFMDYYDSLSKEERAGNIAIGEELREMLLDRFGRYVRAELAKPAGELAKDFDSLTSDMSAVLGESGRWIKKVKEESGLEKA